MFRFTNISLKNHRRRVVTHKTMRKNAKRGHLRAMPFMAAGENYEKSECIGHELEAFHNFAVYADSYETSPVFRYTDNMDDLSLHEKMNACLNRMKEVWKSRDKPALIVKLRHCTQLAKLFDEMCKKDSASLSDYTEDYQYRFYETVESACKIARKVTAEYPDAPAALLYIASVCVNVGENYLEQKCLNLSSHLIGTLNESYPEKVEEPHNLTNGKVSEKSGLLEPSEAKKLT